MSPPIEYQLSITPEPYESAPTPEDMTIEEIEALGRCGGKLCGGPWQNMLLGGGKGSSGAGGEVEVGS